MAAIEEWDRQVRAAVVIQRRFRSWMQRQRHVAAPAPPDPTPAIDALSGMTLPDNFPADAFPVGGSTARPYAGRQRRGDKGRGRSVTDVGSEGPESSHPLPCAAAAEQAMRTHAQTDSGAAAHGDGGAAVRAVPRRSGASSGLCPPGSSRAASRAAAGEGLTSRTSASISLPQLPDEYGRAVWKDARGASLRVSRLVSRQGAADDAQALAAAPAAAEEMLLLEGEDSDVEDDGCGGAGDDGLADSDEPVLLEQPGTSGTPELIAAADDSEATALLEPPALSAARLAVTYSRELHAAAAGEPSARSAPLPSLSCAPDGSQASAALSMPQVPLSASGLSDAAVPQSPSTPVMQAAAETPMPLERARGPRGAVTGGPAEGGRFATPERMGARRSDGAHAFFRRNRRSSLPTYVDSPNMGFDAHGPGASVASRASSVDRAPAPHAAQSPAQAQVGAGCSSPSLPPIKSYSAVSPCGRGPLMSVGGVLPPASSGTGASASAAGRSLDAGSAVERAQELLDMQRLWAPSRPAAPSHSPQHAPTGKRFGVLDAIMGRMGRQALPRLAASTVLTGSSIGRPQAQADCPPSRGAALAAPQPAAEASTGQGVGALQAGGFRLLGTRGSQEDAQQQQPKQQPGMGACGVYKGPAFKAGGSNHAGHRGLEALEPLHGHSPASRASIEGERAPTLHPAPDGLVSEQAPAGQRCSFRGLILTADGVRETSDGSDADLSGPLPPVGPSAGSWSARTAPGGAVTPRLEGIRGRGALFSHGAIGPDSDHSDALPQLPLTGPGEVSWADTGASGDGAFEERERCARSLDYHAGVKSLRQKLGGGSGAKALGHAGNAHTVRGGQGPLHAWVGQEGGAAHQGFVA